MIIWTPSRRDYETLGASSLLTGTPVVGPLVPLPRPWRTCVVMTAMAGAMLRVARGPKTLRSGMVKSDGVPSTSPSSAVRRTPMPCHMNKT
jgi:hypothetical protein